MTTFDERAKDWDANPARVERAYVVAEAMRAALPLTTGMSALEYGCGTGLLSFALQQDFASITLADTSQGMLDVLAEKIKKSAVTNMHPLLVNESFQPIPELRFDVIYSLLTLHHIPDTKAALRHFATLLKPGGFLCVADLEKEDGSFHGPTVTDVHKGFEREALQKLVEDADLTGVNFSFAFLAMRDVNGHNQAFPVFLMVARKI